jgi:hypothetical protein
MSQKLNWKSNGPKVFLHWKWRRNSSKMSFVYAGAKKIIISTITEVNEDQNGKVLVMICC